MDDRQKALADLQIQSMETVLERLGEAKRRADAGEPIHVPWVTLHLRGARDVRGVVLKIGEERHAGKMVLLHAPGMDRSPDYDVIFIPFGTIDALTLHDVPGMFRAPESAGPPPTRLELKRRLAQVGETLAGKVGHPLALELVPAESQETGEPLRAMDLLLTHLEASLTEIAASAQGKEALQNVTRLTLAAGERGGVDREAGTIALIAAVPPLSRMSAANLKSALERVL